jgi:hypothetical protein
MTQPKPAELIQLPPGITYAEYSNLNLRGTPWSVTHHKTWAAWREADAAAILASQDKKKEE